MAERAESVAHAKWVVSTPIVFSPKNRRKIIYNQLRSDIQQYIRDLCKWRGVEILEGHMTPDHVHLLLSIPPKYYVSSFMWYLKRKTAMMILEKHGNLKYKLDNSFLGGRILRKYRRAERGNPKKYIR